MLPVIALVGRPNVGKSTIFNRLTRSRQSIVDDQPGVTRDRLYGRGRVGDQPYIVVDTGGVDMEKGSLQVQIEKQVDLILQECNYVVFVTDAREGLSQLDRGIANKLRQNSTPVIVAVNKSENQNKASITAEFYEMGFEKVVPVSGQHNHGLIELVKQFDLPDLGDLSDHQAGDPMRVSLIGRPNAGKSTLLNRLARAERVIVSEVPGTTRDSVEVALEWQDQDYILIDTAGVRKRGRIEDSIEKLSVIKTMQALESSHLALLMLDAGTEVSEQDVTLAGLIEDSGRSLVIVLNKWDGLDSDQRKDMLSQLQRKLNFLPLCDVIKISALHGTGMGELMAAVNKAHKSAFTVMGTGEINRIMKMAIKEQSPPWKGQRPTKIKYAHQGGKNPPRVIIHGNSLDDLPRSYIRYLSSSVQQFYRLIGTRVVIDLRNSENPYERRQNNKS